MPVKPRDLDVEAWVEWVRQYCPLHGLCSGPRDLVDLCQCPDRTIAALAARGWMQRQLEHPRAAGVTRLDAARRMLEQWDRIKSEFGKVTKYVRTT
jgi:hypothetical protein